MMLFGLERLIFRSSFPLCVYVPLCLFPLAQAAPWRPPVLPETASPNWSLFNTETQRHRGLWGGRRAKSIHIPINTETTCFYEDSGA